MNLDEIVKWLSLPAVVIAALAWWESRRAIRVGRSYNDPVFVMECTPQDWASEELNRVESPGLEVEFKLINIGKSPALNVAWSMDFDPHHLYAMDCKWDIIGGDGGSVDVPTAFRANAMAVPVLGAVLGKGNGADQCTVTYTTQSGEQKMSKVKLPNPYDFRLSRSQDLI